MLWKNQHLYLVSDYANVLLTLHYILSLVRYMVCKLLYDDDFSWTFLAVESFTTAPGKRLATLTTMAIQNVLRGINFAALIPAFEEDRIDNIEVAQNLSDLELTRLGLTTIGDRIRFREKLKECKGLSQVFVVVLDLTAL